MARLLAAKRVPAADDLFHDVLVADLRSQQADARLAQCQFEPDIAHDGGHHRVAAESARSLQVTRAHQHHAVAVHQPAAFVGENRAVAIAVKRDAGGGATLDDPRRHRLRVRRPATEVDVAPVG